MLQDLLRGEGFEVVYQSSKDKATLLEALRAPGDLVVAAGGDGTIGKVAYHLEDRQTPVAILPLGTANNIARSLGISGTAGDLIARLRSMTARRLDVGQVGGPWGVRLFVEGIGIGALAQAGAEVQAADAGPAHKGHALQEALRRTMAGKGLQGSEVRLDDQPVPGDLLLVEALSVAYSGTALPLARGRSRATGCSIWSGSNAASATSCCAGSRTRPMPARRLPDAGAGGG